MIPQRQLNEHSFFLTFWAFMKVRLRLLLLGLLAIPLRSLGYVMSSLIQVLEAAGLVPGLLKRLSNGLKRISK